MTIFLFEDFSVAPTWQYSIGLSACLAIKFPGENLHLFASPPCVFSLLLLRFVVCYLISIVPPWSFQIMTSQNCFAFVFCVCICDISVTNLLPLLLVSTPITFFREAFDYFIIETYIIN